MRRIHITIMLCCLFAGCQSTSPQDVRSALDAVEAATEAARAHLPDHPVTAGAVQLLDVAVRGYHDIAWTEAPEGEGRWPYYLRWLQLAASAVSAVITILDGAGVDVPDLVLQANEVLQRWLR